MVRGCLWALLGFLGFAAVVALLSPTSVSQRDVAQNGASPSPANAQVALPDDESNLTDMPHATSADSGDDQPIMPEAGSQPTRLEKAKVDTVKLAKIHIDECISNWLDSLPGTTSRRQAEDIVIEKCRPAWGIFVNISDRYGFPSEPPRTEGAWRDYVHDQINDRFGPPDPRAPRRASVPVPNDRVNPSPFAY